MSDQPLYETNVISTKTRLMILFFGGAPGLAGLIICIVGGLKFYTVHFFMALLIIALYVTFALFFSWFAKGDLGELGYKFRWLSILSGFAYVFSLVLAIMYVFGLPEKNPHFPEYDCYGFYDPTQKVCHQIYSWDTCYGSEKCILFVDGTSGVCRNCSDVIPTLPPFVFPTLRN
eukprot:TRINITY_DN7617_c0_g1_i1.p1 TRINITY_DN7617_c0_g1~~TRINITY_DN7617_c0_g1_i1.p1  ORF type:complete len:184 (-),score=19.15 TRINITY_DN7617_c0_g1_i1:105-626(-)